MKISMKKNGADENTKRHSRGAFEENFSYC